MLRIAAVSLAMTVAGCAGSAGVSSPPSAAMSQADVKAAVMAARITFKDPDSIRDTRIGQPYSSGCWGEFAHMITSAIDTCVCVAVNARNSYGGYTGLQTQVALISRGVVVDFIKARIHDQCDGLTPWPEFDGKART